MCVVVALLVVSEVNVRGCEYGEVGGGVRDWVWKTNSPEVQRTVVESCSFMQVKKSEQGTLVGFCSVNGYTRVESLYTGQLISETLKWEQWRLAHPIVFEGPPNRRVSTQTLLLRFPASEPAGAQHNAVSWDVVEVIVCRSLDAKKKNNNNTAELH